MVKTDFLKAERRWARGSWITLAYALFIFITNTGLSIYSFTLPSDGWHVNQILTSNPPILEFEQSFLENPTQIQPDDQLMAVNGRSLEQILDEQYAFYDMHPPNWSDGALLHYDVLRDGKRLRLEVLIQRVGWWEVFVSAVRVQGVSGLVQILGSTTFFIIGLIVFFLRPGNRAAHALLLIGVGFFFNAMPANSSVPTLFYPLPPASVPFDTWTAVINPSLMYLALVFPRPKRPIRRYPGLTVALLYLPWLIVFNLVYLLNLHDPDSYNRTAFTLYPIQIVIVMLITLASLVHGAVTVRDPVGRSQFKWMLLGVGGFVFVGIGGWLTTAYITQGANLSWAITTIGWFLLPICLAIAITRHRLFDIDVIIRKTLVYTLLSITLALVYFGGVVILQTIFDGITGQGSPAAIVISTLGIAALFTPLRSRIQTIIDKRFYRQKYNAEKALAQFAFIARNPVEIGDLRGTLLTVIDETIQPESVSLWIREQT